MGTAVSPPAGRPTAAGSSAIGHLSPPGERRLRRDGRSRTSAVQRPLVVARCWRTRRPPPSPSPLLRPIRRRGGRTTRSAATFDVAVPSAQVAVMDLPPSAAPRRRVPPQGRLCGRSSARSERRRFAALVAVLAGAPVFVARPRPRPKGTTALGKPAPCGSRASPDPGHRPSTCRTVRPRRDPGAGGTRRQPSPARPAVVAYRISPRSRCGLPEPRQRGRPVHNPEPDIAGFTPKRFQCYTANQVDSFVGHIPLFPRDFSIRRAAPCDIRAD